MSQSLMISLADRALVEDRRSRKARAIMLFENFIDVSIGVLPARKIADMCDHVPADGATNNRYLAD